ncbi:MAG: hypothetical protein WBB85_09250 [Albidovulum sp.]|uniref:hypothetical protein n=1 Tax=Albidovulum sp. TaxID=1872424 RepID=UPI003CADC256
MKSIIFAAAAVMLLPVAASADDIVFDCQVENAAQPEMAARLFQEEGQMTGFVTIDGTEMEALIYEAAESRTFLYLGDDYSLSYTVNIDTGAYEYFADGSKAAEANGICIAAPDKLVEASPDLKS